jgi:hypothetical protein
MKHLYPSATTPHNSSLSLRLPWMLQQLLNPQQLWTTLMNSSNIKQSRCRINRICQRATQGCLWGLFSRRRWICGSRFCCQWWQCHYSLRSPMVDALLEGNTVVVRYRVRDMRDRITVLPPSPYLALGNGNLETRLLRRPRHNNRLRFNCRLRSDKSSRRPKFAPAKKSLYGW